MVLQCKVASAVSSPRPAGGWRGVRPWLSALAMTAALLSGAHADDAEIDEPADTFVAGLPAGWHVTAGRWEFFDLPTCFNAGGPCFGNNPSSPYGYPLFPGGRQVWMDASEAVVLFLRTPPPVRHFGFTQYLVSRGFQVRPVTASMSESSNIIDFKPLGGLAGGRFERPSVLVMAADLGTLNTVTQSGVASVDDREFTDGSALSRRVRRLDDPRVARCAGLFAYAVSYDCSGMSFCFEIPAPTPDNPVGLVPGAPFGLLARAYVEPRTGARPDPAETVRERVLLGRVR